MEEKQRQKERVSLGQSDNELETYNKLQTGDERKSGFYKQSPASSKHSRSPHIQNLELNVLPWTHTHIPNTFNHLYHEVHLQNIASEITFGLLPCIALPNCSLDWGFISQTLKMNINWYTDWEKCLNNIVEYRPCSESVCNVVSVSSVFLPLGVEIC